MSRIIGRYAAVAVSGTYDVYEIVGHNGARYYQLQLEDATGPGTLIEATISGAIAPGAWPFQDDTLLAVPVI